MSAATITVLLASFVLTIAALIVKLVVQKKKESSEFDSDAIVRDANYRAHNELLVIELVRLQGEIETSLERMQRALDRREKWFQSLDSQLTSESRNTVRLLQTMGIIKVRLTLFLKRLNAERSIEVVEINGKQRQMN